MDDSNIDPCEWRRAALPHTAPASVLPYTRADLYFVTQCVNRATYGIVGDDVGRKGPLCGPLADAIISAMDFYRATQRFFVEQVVVMPDHIHLIGAFKNESIAKSMTAFKRYTAHACGITWQKDFFDHRLRSQAELTEKWNYIAMNPVRKGLCETPEAWRYRKVWNLPW